MNLSLLKKKFLALIFSSLILVSLSLIGTQANSGVLTNNFWYVTGAVFFLFLCSLGFGLLYSGLEQLEVTNGNVSQPSIWWQVFPISLWISSLITQYLSPFSFLPFIFWILSLLAVLVFSLPDLKSTAPKVSSAEGFSILIIIALGIFMRFWHLPAMPFKYDGDVASVGIAALEIVTGKESRWLGAGWGQMPISYLRIWSSGMSIFGDTLGGLSASLAAVGVLGIISVWIFAKIFGGPLCGIFAALFCATSFAHIHFSRALYIEPSSIALCLEMSCLLLWIRTRKLSLLFLCAILCGYSLTLYESARVGPPVILLIIILMTLTGEIKYKSALRCLFIFFAGLIVGWGPYLLIAISNLHEFSGRANSVTIFSPEVRRHLLGKYAVDSFWLLILEQCKRSFFAFTYFSDTSPHAGFPRPLLDPLLRWCAALGLGICVARIRDPRFLLPILWIFLVSFFGGVLTCDPPYWPHLIAALPACILLGSVGVTALIQILSNQSNRLCKSLIYIPMLMLLTLSISSTWLDYVEIATHTSDEYSLIYRYLERFPSGSKVLIAQNGIDWHDRRFEFMAAHIDGGSVSTQLFSPRDLSPNTTVIGSISDRTTLVQKYTDAGITDIEINTWRPDGQISTPLLIFKRRGSS